MGVSTMSNPRVLYFAHAVNSYNTLLEKTIIGLIYNHFPKATIENPNQPHHQVGYRKYAQRTKESGATHKGMNYFFDEVLPKCDECIAMPFLDGRMGLGVAGEAKWFASRDIPVWVVLPSVYETTQTLEKIICNPLIESTVSNYFRIRLLTEEESLMLFAKIHD